MQPQQPNYDFIFQPPQQQKPVSGMGVRIAIVAGGLALLVLILIIGFSIVRGGSGGNIEALRQIAIDQSEIARIADIAERSATDQDTKNITATVAATIKTDQAEFTTYLGKVGIKVGEKELTAAQDGDITTQLDNAKSASTFDTTYRGVMERQLASYRDNLEAAYQGVGNEGRTVLQKSFNNAQVLARQFEN